MFYAVQTLAFHFLNLFFCSLNASMIALFDDSPVAFLITEEGYVFLFSQASNLPHSIAP
jgi:hypothetical protein